jgi:Ricin-type beta-trefoil lectin domain-like
MTLDGVSQQIDGASGQKPTALKSSPAGVIFALLAMSCGTTPVDAVVADEAGLGTNDPVAGSVCAAPAAGRFSLSGESGCLRRGGLTSVFGNAAEEVELSADCTAPAAQWDLTPAVAGTFTLRNVENQLSLDVRAAADVPGTPIILYDPNTLDNQRFWFRPRGGEIYELAPRHAPTLCAKERATGAVEIWPCDTTDTGQAFRVARFNCP